jgi:Tfp pilus assembly protein PilE
VLSHKYFGHHLSFNNMRKVTGIGLLELMLSLAIIAILLLVATRYYESTRTSQQVNEALEMVIAVFDAGNSYLQSNDSFPPNVPGQDMIAVFASTNDVPSDFTKPNANPWGGGIRARETNGTQLIVQMDRVPMEACQNLLAKVQAKLNSLNSACDPDLANLATFRTTLNFNQ